MNYFFTPFALVNQYQPYYAFAPQILVQTKTYYLQQSQFQKQIALQKQNTFLFERQDASKLIDQHLDNPKRPKKSKKKEDKNFGFRQQDKERNIFSNILKGFFLALNQKRSMDIFIQKMLLEKHCQMNLQQFLQKVSEIFCKCRSYFSPKSIRQILKCEKDQQNVRNIIRICLCNYLKTQFSISLLLSNRIKRKSKLLQMKKARELLSILKGCE